MILTRKDYEKAYKILDTEWENEVKPALVEIHSAFEKVSGILEPYKTTATLCNISTDPYQFFHHLVECLRNTIEYAKNPMCFYCFVQGTKTWTCILGLDPTNRESRSDMSNIHKGLLYWRKKVNEIKDGIRLFYENGAKYLENYVTNLINDRLAPKANEQADEFLSAFGMTKKIPKVKITITLSKVK
jgi:hypothetical protein